MKIQKSLVSVMRFSSGACILKELGGFYRNFRFSDIPNKGTHQFEEQKGLILLSAVICCQDMFYLREIDFL